MECDWWKRRLLSEKGLRIICILLLLTCSVLIAVNIVTKHKLNLSEDAVNSVCHSEECISAAARILESMDDTVEPCKDFYHFACGNYVKRNFVAEDYYWKTTLQTLQADVQVRIKKILESHQSKNDSKTLRKAKKLYSSCMNTSTNEDGSLKTLLNLLTDDGIGEWPILKPKWNKNYIDLGWRLAKLYVHGMTPFFDLRVDYEDTPSDNYFLAVTVGNGPFLNPKSYLNSSDLKFIQYFQSYKNLISETFRLLRVEESRSKEDIADMLQFEIEFAKIYEQRYETEDLEDDELNPQINISMLEKEIPEVKWDEFFDTVFEDIGLRYRSSDLIVVVDYWMHLKELVKLLKRTPPRTVANYLTWRFVAKYLPYLDFHFRRLYDYFDKEVKYSERKSTSLPRWRECIHVVNGKFELELASAYLKEDFDQGIENEVSLLITSIKEAFLTSIRRQSWLDDDTKISCSNKIAALGEEIGDPKLRLNSNKLDAYNATLDITEDSFLDNILKMDRYDQFKILRRITGVEDYEMMDINVPPLDATAMYSHLSNTIHLSAGLLKIPMFTPHFFSYVNFASLGAIIGHEITHGLATKHHLLSPDYGLPGESPREPIPWCFENVLEKFMKKQECFEEQYSQFPTYMIGHNVNGSKTFEENLCDDSAVRQAYTAYKHYVSEHGEEPRLSGMKYSNDQVFFLQYAQVWCEVLNEDAHRRLLVAKQSPGKYRATVPLMNFPEFSSAFNCPAGSPMNPVKKCRFWD